MEKPELLQRLRDFLPEEDRPLIRFLELYLPLKAEMDGVEHAITRSRGMKLEQQLHDIVKLRDSVHTPFYTPFQGDLKYCHAWLRRRRGDIQDVFARLDSIVTCYRSRIEEQLLPHFRLDAAETIAREVWKGRLPRKSLPEKRLRRADSEEDYEIVHSWEYGIGHRIEHIEHKFRTLIKRKEADIAALVGRNEMLSLELEQCTSNLKSYYSLTGRLDKELIECSNRCSELESAYANMSAENNRLLFELDRSWRIVIELEGRMGAARDNVGLYEVDSHLNPAQIVQSFDELYTEVSACMHRKPSTCD